MKYVLHDIENLFLNIITACMVSCIVISFCLLLGYQRYFNAILTLFEYFVLLFTNIG
jgi:hypothetical protein